MIVLALIISLMCESVVLYLETDIDYPTADDTYRDHNGDGDGSQ